MAAVFADLGIPDDPHQPPRRRDANAAHFRAFKSCMDSGFDRFFGAVGDDQIHLWLLCTDPKFRRRGAGSRLCRWGIERAALDHKQATVLASPMGKVLYEEMGFRLCGSFFVHCDDDDESQKLEIWALSHPKADFLLDVGRT